MNIAHRDLKVRTVAFVVFVFTPPVVWPLPVLSVSVIRRTHVNQMVLCVCLCWQEGLLFDDRFVNVTVCFYVFLNVCIYISYHNRYSNRAM